MFTDPGMYNASETTLISPTLHFHAILTTNSWYSPVFKQHYTLYPSSNTLRLVCQGLKLFLKLFTLGREKERDGRMDELLSQVMLNCVLSMFVVCKHSINQHNIHN
jgi:hypothetical protein